MSKRGGGRRSKTITFGENSLYDTTSKYDSLFDTQIFSLPYMTPSVNVLPYMTL
jgi:hypothetical protein